MAEKMLTGLLNYSANQTKHLEGQKYNNVYNVYSYSVLTTFAAKNYSDS